MNVERVAYRHQRGGALVTLVDTIDCDDLRVVLCLQFDPGAGLQEVAALKSALIDSPYALHSVESVGSFDFLVELAPHDMPSFDEWRKRYWPKLSKVVTRCETSFLCKRYVRRRDVEHALWVRSGDGLKRVDLAAVDKIIADGDYVQVFGNGQKWLLHSTMHKLRSELSHDFVQLHRSLIVRRGFIDRLSHRGRSWNAHLRDGSLERISRSHVTEALDVTRSSVVTPDSSTILQFSDQTPPRLTKN
ncbi:MAG TPA: LytTR family DNA-binding domain-containing protein [Sphingomicrobium sp.]|nr:LytTR family DNA-binding domain-containing protein [Sphingomicrobium sp.]